MADHDPEKQQSTCLSSTLSTLNKSKPPSQKSHKHDEEIVSDNDGHSSHLSSHSSSLHSLHSLHSIPSNPLSPLEIAISQPSLSALSRLRTATSIGTTGSRLPDYEVDFLPDDSANPKNWPLWYKGLTVFAMSFGTWSVVFYSTSYTSSMPGMMREWHIRNEPLTTLGITTYLLGLAVGSLILAPMSEIYGRRPVYAVCMALFAALVVPCALATSLVQIIVIRFFGAMAGACMISNATGTLADISTESNRALVFSIWSIGPMNGPVTGPLIGGFAYQYLGWRWTNWLVLIFSGAAWVFVSFIHESYAPALLKRKAAARRAETDDSRYWSRYDVKLPFLEELKLNLTRPFSMAFTEPILWFWNLYISVIYGEMYLCFTGYPVIFTNIRGWSAGFSGLGFAGIGVGTMIAIVSEPLIRRMINAHKVDPATDKIPPEATISIVCVAAVLAPVGQLVFSWTATPVSIHWIWSILAGIPFGAGNTIVFIYSSNYIAGSYGIYAASALAGNAVIRSLFGGTLPLAGPAMYKKMTPRWAGTFLGLLEVLLIPIPFVFYRYGGKIRAKSPLIRQMKEDQEKLERKQVKKTKCEGRAAVGESEVLEKAVVRADEKV